jgi:LytR cell envelope-related transcriptional attenuator
MSDDRLNAENVPAPAESPGQPGESGDAGSGVRGYRSSKRTSKGAKAAKSTARKGRVGDAVDRTGRTARNVMWLLGWVLIGLIGLVVVLLVAASAINGVARWNAKRAVASASSGSEAARRARENLLVIGADATNTAVGFIAVRVDQKRGQVFGIAIPDGAFLEVPGQGFERIGESFSAGPQVSLSAVSNFLGVPFQRYVVVPAEEYQRAVKGQSIARILPKQTSSNLSASERSSLEEAIAKTEKENVAIVPLPVKPITLGNVTYFEPQRAQVADVVKSWWGVDLATQQKATKVILYNGVGTPGIAGQAAQELIRAGFRVVDTKNADKFGYAETLIVVQSGPVAAGRRAATVLGVGKVVDKPTDQSVADLVIIVGKDYKP